MKEVITNNSIQEPKEALSNALNFQELRNVGLNAIIKTGSDTWTDYNEHDPGITIFENLIYGLTDLAYRTDFPIEDIIAQQQLSAEELAQKQFYTARQVLTSDPVSFKDIRKIIIDEEGVTNAWVQKSRDSLNSFGGLIDLLVDANSANLSNNESQLLANQIKQTYFKYRMMGQDLGQIIIRKPLEILLNLEIVLAPTALAEEVIAEILSTLATYFANAVSFLSFQEMLEKVEGDINQVFNGPALKHGFLPDEALLPIKNSFHATDIIPIITAIPKVVLVEGLMLLTAPQEQKAIIQNTGTPFVGTAKGKWFHQIDIPKTSRPILASIGKHSLAVKKGDTPCELNVGRLEFEYRKCLSKKRKPKLSAKKRDISIPAGNFRDLTQYYSIDKEFPQIYGLPPYGPPPNASEKQRGQIKQLRSFLLFFDQIMADYLAQLANLGKLFSWDSQISRTYFCQGLESSVTSLGDLLFDFPLHPNENNKHITELALKGYKQKLALFREDETTFLKRRNRFLNHLLARFGRNLDTYLESVNQSSLKEQLQTEIETKLSVLNHYPVMSARKGRAYNRYQQVDFSDQFSGLRQWTERLLDMMPENEATFYFNKRFVTNPYIEKGVNENEAFSKYILKTIDDSPLDFKEIMRIGGEKENYQIDYRPDTGHHILLFKNTNPSQPATIYQLTETFDSAKKTRKVITELADLIKKYDATSERIHIVEHLLLRPTPIEYFFGLQLLDKNGQAWMKTNTWYTKNELGQITAPPAANEQFYYCIKTEQEPNPPCSEEVVDNQKSSKTNTVKKTIYPKYIFFIEPIAPKAPVLRYQIKLLFGELGKIIELSSITPYETESLAKETIENWITRLKKYFSASNDSTAQIPLWEPLLKPWTTTASTKTTNQPILKDPYSFVFTVAIPDWPSRFQQEGFKKALEKIIHFESPAHLLPNLLWLNKSNMQTLTDLHRSWWNSYLNNEPDAYIFRRELMQFILNRSTIF